MLPLWFSQSIYFNINKKENYISISRIAFVYVKKFLSLSLVLNSSCVFSALVVSIHHLWISIHSDLWSTAPVKYLSSTLFLNEHNEEKKGAELVPSFSLAQQHYDDRQIFVSLVQSCCLFLVHVFTYRAISFNACSVLLPNRSLFVRSMKKQWNIFTHDREKNRGLQKWNRRKKRAIIMCNFQTQNIIQP